MITTRTANVTDLDWLIKQCRAFADFYDSKKSVMGSDEYAMEFLSNMIKNHVVFIALVNEERSGFIAGMKQPHHFNPAITVLSELFWWVTKEYRGSRSGAILLDEFVKYGKENCDWMTFTLEEVTPISDKALLKRGFRLTEKAYLSEVQ